MERIERSKTDGTMRNTRRAMWWGKGWGKGKRWRRDGEGKERGEGKGKIENGHARKSAVMEIGREGRGEETEGMAGRLLPTQRRGSWSKGGNGAKEKAAGLKAIAVARADVGAEARRRTTPQPAEGTQKTVATQHGVEMDEMRNGQNPAPLCGPK